MRALYASMSGGRVNDVAVPGNNQFPPANNINPFVLGMQGIQALAAHDARNGPFPGYQRFFLNDGVRFVDLAVVDNRLPLIEQLVVDNINDGMEPIPQNQIRAELRRPVVPNQLTMYQLLTPQQLQQHFRPFVRAVAEVVEPGGGRRRRGGSWEYKMTAVRKKLNPLLNTRDELEDTLMRLQSIGRAYKTSPKAKKLELVNKKINALENELEYWMQQEQKRLPTIPEEEEIDGGRRKRHGRKLRGGINWNRHSEEKERMYQEMADYAAEIDKRNISPYEKNNLKTRFNLAIEKHYITELEAWERRNPFNLGTINPLQPGRPYNPPGPKIPDFFSKDAVNAMAEVGKCLFCTP
jgi:hypothetical protein